MGSEKMNIKVMEATMIQPAKETPKMKLWNSDVDLLVGRIHILTIYFYKSNGSTNFFEARVLKESLRNVLVSFFPMAGRLGKDDNGRVEINCNGEGVLFVEAESDSTVDDFGDFTPSPELKRLTPAVDYSVEIDSCPLVVIQVTYFKCGGVSLGVGIHHTLSDGFSSLHFVNTWSDTARGLSIAVPPFIDRTLLRAWTPPTPKFEHIEYHPPPSMNTTRPPQSGPKAISTTILKLTLDQLNALKATAKNEGTTKDRSTYEILAAHLWRCACKARGLAGDQMSKLHIATDGRARLSPPLPPGYLGNVLFTATPMAVSGELVAESLTGSAGRIHSALTRMDDEYLRSALDYLELQTNLKALVRGPNYFASPNLNINSWSRLPVYDADFGWGRPIFMGPAIILYEGTIYILPSPTNDRSLLLAVCLEAGEMPLFKKYLYEF